jgi:hypothetical protein
MPFDSGTMRFVRQRAEIGIGVSRDPDQSNFDDLLTVLPTLTVDEVVELVESGEADLEDVIEAEKVGKARKTILALVKSDSGRVYSKPNSD